MSTAIPVVKLSLCCGCLGQSLRPPWQATTTSNSSTSFFFFIHQQKHCEVFCSLPHQRVSAVSTPEFGINSLQSCHHCLHWDFLEAELAFKGAMSFPDSELRTMGRLTTIPAGVRNKIIEHVFTEPEKKPLKNDKDILQYKNYFAISLVNRQLYAEVTEYLKASHILVLVASNYGGLDSQLTQHEIPVVSNKLSTQAKKCTTRIHIRYPTKETAVKCQVLLLQKSLKCFAFLLRSFSLEIDHPPGIPVTSDGGEFPRLSVAIHLRADEEGNKMSMKEQESLCVSLQVANRVGKIKIIGATSPKLGVLLPGYSYRYSADAGTFSFLQVLAKGSWFRACRQVDGTDTIKIAKWKLCLAKTALDMSDFPRAIARFTECIRFMSQCIARNPYILSPTLTGHIENTLDTILFKAGIGLVRSLIAMGRLKDARKDIKPVLDDLSGRTWLPEADVQTAKRLSKFLQNLSAQSGM
ncbi:hypothetical protein BP6252_11960 [Coleophoma cylindrospora]|uniref:Uncharacterized protein n=1 Tax=Coleophoma cylindrospora TaxID=1849047 RepID=A0A3D8QFS5_9HELO|nr:hypothetical protein BP6252_11960 [Coleophoma cylindrospora]